MRKTIVALIVLMIVPLLAGAGDRVAIAQQAYCASTAESDMLWRINDLRRQHGLQPLTLSHPIGVAADAKASDMAARDYVAHVSPDGRDVQAFLRDAGYTYNTSYAENVAAGNQGAAATFNQWLNSPAHREIMLGEQYTAIGIGRAHNPDSTYGWYWSALFGGTVGEPAACGETPTNSLSSSSIAALIAAIIQRILANL